MSIEYQDDDVVPGGDTTPPEPAAPPNLSKFETRLNDIARTLSTVQHDQQQRDSRSQMAQHEAQVAQKVRSAQGAVDAAERDLSKALEDGDGAAIAKAQRNMTERVADRERAVNVQDRFKAAMRSMEARSGGSSGAPGTPGAAPQRPDQNEELETKNLEGWKSQNESWYGIDSEMTKAAHEVDQEIREAGVITVGTPEYFKAIDRKMAQRYPSRFNNAPQTAGSGSGGGRQQAPNSAGRIPRDVVDGWARMGINVNDDATLNRMVKNRQALADKGILPQQPEYGRVVNR